MTRFELPSRRQEAWRWSDLSLAEKALATEAAATQPVSGEPPAAIDPERWFLDDVPGPRLLFVDGRYRPELSAPEGIEVRAANIGQEDIGQEIAHPLGELAASAATGGIRLRVAPGHASVGTVQLVHLATGGVAHLAHDIELGEDAQAAIIETYARTAEGQERASWTNVAVRVRLSRSARLMRSVRALASPSGLLTGFTRARVGQGASYDSLAFAAGGDARIESEVELVGAGAFAGVDGALLGRGTQVLDVLSRIHHQVPDTTSRQTWRSVVDGQATASVAAGVEVARGANGTDAEQSLRALLLGRTGTANLKPELAIYADDVRCAHGAAVGDLDQAALFYLASRGVPPVQARAMLTEAFVAGVLDSVGQEPLRKALAGELALWLGSDG